MQAELFKLEKKKKEYYINQNIHPFKSNFVQILSKNFIKQNGMMILRSELKRTKSKKDYLKIGGE